MLFRSPHIIDITGRPELQAATRWFFGGQEPKTAADWSYLNMLVNFFTGNIKAKASRKNQGDWYEYQLSEGALDALDIIGLRYWWRRQFPEGDVKMIQKPSTIAEKVPLYRISPLRDEIREKAAGRLGKLMGVDIRPRVNEVVDTPLSDDENAELAASIAAVANLLR